MSKGLPEEIEEAKEFFEWFEKSDDHEERWPLFRDAIESFNEHLEDNPDSPHKKYIENLKFTYTRKMLEQFAKLPTMVKDDAFFYWVLLALVKAEIDKITETRPDLYKAYHDFYDRWQDEALEYLKELEEAKKSSGAISLKTKTTNN